VHLNDYGCLSWIADLDARSWPARARNWKFAIFPPSAFDQKAPPRFTLAGDPSSLVPLNPAIFPQMHLLFRSCISIFRICPRGQQRSRTGLPYRAFQKAGRGPLPRSQILSACHSSTPIPFLPRYELERIFPLCSRGLGDPSCPGLRAAVKARRSTDFCSLLTSTP